MSEYQYLNDDEISIIAEFSGFITLSRITKVNTYFHEKLKNILIERLKCIPWEIYVEYNIENNIIINKVCLTIGYNFNSNNLIICDNIKFTIYHGKLPSIIDYIKINKSLNILLFIDNKDKIVKLIDTNKRFPKGNLYYKEVNMDISKLDEYFYEGENNINFNDVMIGELPYNAFLQICSNE